MIISTDRIFKHYKGNYYLLLIDNAILEINGDRMVVYKKFPKGAIFVRPYCEFFNDVAHTVHNGVFKPRFYELTEKEKLEVLKIGKDYS